jgi:mono/diheme cytochrome c family protein
MRPFGLCFAIVPFLAGQAALAADANEGKRLAETRCVPCHVLTGQRRQVSDAPPFDIIAAKFNVAPEILAFLLLHPHPRMNEPLTRREAEDIAAYITSLAK